MNSWQGRAVTITGGCGFIGSNLARELLARGAVVRLVDNLERGQLSFIEDFRNQVEFVQADLREAQAAREAVRGADTVFHLAAQVGGIKVYQDKAGSVLNNNLLIDQNIFAAIVAMKCPRVFYASSAHVYPRQLQQSPDAPALKEADAEPADPILTYGWGKRLGEITLLALAAEFPWMQLSIARIMGAYGYNQDFALETGSAIPVFAHRAAIWPVGAPFRLWGTGRETRSFVFITDVVDGMLRSVEALSEQRIVGPFNLAAEGRVTIAELAETIIRLSGKAIPIEYVPGAPTAIWGQAADTALAARLLHGWHARVSLAEGLRLSYAHVGRRLDCAKG